MIHLFHNKEQMKEYDRPDFGYYVVEVSLSQDTIIDLLNWARYGDSCGPIEATVVENITPTFLSEALLDTQTDNNMARL